MPKTIDPVKAQLKDELKITRSNYSKMRQDYRAEKRRAAKAMERERRASCTADRNFSRAEKRFARRIAILEGRLGA